MKNQKDNQIWIPAQVAIRIFIASLFNKWANLSIIQNIETSDTYYYINGKYICHKYVALATRIRK